MPEELRIDLKVWSELNTKQLLSLPQLESKSVTTYNIFYIDEKVLVSLSVNSEYSSKNYIAEFQNGNWTLIDNQISRLRVKELIKDKAGYYWVYISLYDGDTSTNLYRFTGNISSPQNIEAMKNVKISGLFNDSQNRLWLQVDNGILLFENNNFIQYYFEEFEYCCSIIESSNGNIYFSTSNSNLWCYNTSFGYWEKIVTNFPTNNPPAPFVQTGDKLIFLRNRIICTFDGNQWAEVQLSIPGTPKQLLSVKQNEIWNFNWSNKAVYQIKDNTGINLIKELKIYPEIKNLTNVIIRSYENHVFFIIRQDYKDEYFEYTYN